MMVLQIELKMIALENDNGNVFIVVGLQNLSQKVDHTRRCTVFMFLPLLEPFLALNKISFKLSIIMVKYRNLNNNL